MAKPIIQENRFGIIKVPFPFLRYEEDYCKLKIVFNKLDLFTIQIYDCPLTYSKNFKVFCKDFDPVPNGCEIPEYIIEFTEDDEGYADELRLVKS